LRRARSSIAGKLGDDFFERCQARGMHEPQQAHFEMQARIGLATDIVFRVEQDLEETSEVLFAELCGGLREVFVFFWRSRDQIGIGAADAGDEKIAEVADSFAAELLKILPFGEQLMNEGKDTRRGTFGDGRRQLVHDAAGDDAQDFADLILRDAIAAIRQGLFQQGKPVAQAAIGGTGDDGERSGLGGDFFLFGDRYEMNTTVKPRRY
jgi:hypothetical protein